jgi:hypothetical protein
MVDLREPERALARSCEPQIDGARLDVGDETLERSYEF